MLGTMSVGSVRESIKNSVTLHNLLSKIHTEVGPVDIPVGKVANGNLRSRRSSPMDDVDFGISISNDFVGRILVSIRSTHDLRRTDGADDGCENKRSKQEKARGM